MRLLAYMFLLLGLVSFIISTSIRFDMFSLRHDAATFIEIAMLAVLFSIAFGTLSNCSRNKH